VLGGIGNVEREMAEGGLLSTKKLLSAASPRERMSKLVSKSGSLSQKIGSNESSPSPILGLELLSGVMTDSGVATPSEESGDV
jgi:hypothetical protein